VNAEREKNISEARTSASRKMPYMYGRAPRGYLTCPTRKYQQGERGGERGAIRLLDLSIFFSCHRIPEGITMAERTEQIGSQNFSGPFTGAQGRETLQKGLRS